MLSAAKAHGGPALTTVACVGSHAGSLRQESQRHKPSPKPNCGRGARKGPGLTPHACSVARPAVQRPPRREPGDPRRMWYARGYGI